MIVTGKEDLRVQKTMDAISQTFRSMICEMDYEKITVTALCARARINKKTFYRYYPTLDDLLAELQNALSSEYLKRIQGYRIPEDLDKINREFFLFSVEHGQVYERITCSGSYLPIRQTMMDRVMASSWGEAKEIAALPPFSVTAMQLCTYSCSVELYKQWVAAGKPIPVEELIALSNRMLWRGLDGILEKAKGG